MPMPFKGMESNPNGNTDAQPPGEMSPAQLEGHGLLPNGKAAVTKVGWMTDWAANKLGNWLGLDGSILGLGIEGWHELLPGYSGLKLLEEQRRNRESL